MLRMLISGEAIKGLLLIDGILHHLKSLKS